MEQLQRAKKACPVDSGRLLNQDGEYHTY